MQGKTISFGAIRLLVPAAMLMMARFTLMAICHPITSSPTFSRRCDRKGIVTPKPSGKLSSHLLAGQLANDVNELLTALC
jgi:hypothetical protein